MNYSLHPEAEADLRDAAKFYRERAGNSLSKSFLAEFEQSVNILLQHSTITHHLASQRACVIYQAGKITLNWMW